MSPFNGFLLVKKHFQHYNKLDTNNRTDIVLSGIAVVNIQLISKITSILYESYLIALGNDYEVVMCAATQDPHLQKIPHNHEVCNSFCQNNSLKKSLNAEQHLNHLTRIFL